MKTLVTGANGFIGKYLCAELCRQKHTVVVAVRSDITKMDDVDQVFIVSIDNATDWSGPLRDVQQVIHLAARVHVMNDSVADPLTEFRKVNVDGTLHLAQQSAKAGVKRFIFMSSVKVNGEYTEIGKPFKEDSPANPQDAYGVSKFEAEQGLFMIAQNTGMEVVIIRPPLVYGAGVKGNFIRMMKVIARGFPLPFASVHNRRDLVYVENLVDALISCATNPNAAGKTYLVSDGESVSTPNLIRDLAKALGKSNLVFPLPIAVMRFCAGLLGKSAAVDRLTQSLQIDSSKIRKELGWKPLYTMEQGLKATAEWYLSQQKK